MALCLEVGGAVSRILLSVVITQSLKTEMCQGEKESEEYVKGEGKGKRKTISVIMLYCSDHMMVFTRPSFVHSSHLGGKTESEAALQKLKYPAVILAAALQAGPETLKRDADLGSCSSGSASDIDYQRSG